VTKPPVVSGNSIVLPGALKLEMLTQLPKQLKGVGELVVMSNATRTREPATADVSMLTFDGSTNC
jgi:hypothetical protein